MSAPAPASAPTHAAQLPTAQYKIVSRSPVLRRVYGGLLSLLMPLFAWVAPRWSRRGMRAIGRFLAWSFWLVRPKYAMAVARNVAQVTGLPAGDPEVRRTAYRMHYHHAYFWIDLFHFSGKTEAEIQRHVAYIRGDEKLQAALAGGRGVILATAHVGNWELGGLLLGKRSVPVTVVYSRDRFQEIEQFRSRARVGGQMKEIAVSDSFLAAVPLIAALRRGEVVALQADRDWNDSGLAVPFLGKPAYFPTGPALLARASGAPILFCTILHEPGMRYGITVEGPLELQATDDRQADVEENVRRIAAHVEAQVREHVDQWYCYYDLWGDAAERLARKPPASRRHAGRPGSGTGTGTG